MAKKTQEKENLKEGMENMEAEEAKEEKEDAKGTKDESKNASEEASGEDEVSEDEENDEKPTGDSKIDELNDRIKRQMAEFENFRKRSEKEKMQMYDMGAKAILEKILPAIDNFERGLLGVKEDSKDPFEMGMQMVYKQMMTTLEEAGLKAIPAKGETFNPEYHNAVMHEEDDSFGENEIIEELQKGYMFHDSVVRHSMVKVAN